MNTKQWYCLAVATLGLAILMWGKIQVDNWFAVLAGLGSAITYSVYILVSARFQKSVKPLSSSLYVITFSALALYIFHRPNMHAALTLSTMQASSVIGIAIICTILPLTLVLAGLQKMKSSEAALLTMVEPITATILALCLFDETLSARQAIGALLVLAALAARTMWSKSVF
jgi:drug/metabolite transporter (DMT)-like permease